MNHHLSGGRGVLEGDVQLLGCQEPDSNVLKSPLLDGDITHVSELVLINDDDDEGKTMVRMLRTVLSPTNCGDIRLQYIRAVQYEISHSPASNWRSNPGLWVAPVLPRNRRAYSIHRYLARR